MYSLTKSNPRIYGKYITVFTAIQTYTFNGNAYSVVVDLHTILSGQIFMALFPVAGGPTVAHIRTTAVIFATLFFGKIIAGVGKKIDKCSKNVL